MTTLHLPPGILGAVIDPEPFRDYICAVCRDPTRRVAGVLMPAAHSEDLCLVYDETPTILEAPTLALVVGTVRANPRPGTFCARCCEQFKEWSLARGGCPWPGDNEQERGRDG